MSDYEIFDEDTNATLYRDESYYGDYTNLSFEQIWKDADAFLGDYANNGIPTTIKTETASLLYYLLYGRYGMSVMAGDSLPQWKARVFGIIWQYGPTWEKRLEVQKRVRELSEADLRNGDLNIANQAYNPGTEPTTASNDILGGIAQQNTTNLQRSILGGYSMLESLLAADVSEEFLARFKDCFRVVLAPDKIKLYAGGEL